MPYFIAEVSSNHSSSLERCIQFIDIAAEIGCEVIKFQLFKIDQLFASEILQKSPSHNERRQWELPISFIPEISKRCKAKNIKFACTPFYLDAVDELNDYVDIFKISSYELLWLKLLEKVAETTKQTIVSTGMAETREILNAVDVFNKNGIAPTLLHCTSAYPTPITEANLAAIETLRKLSKCEVGWSDHTVNEGVIQRAIHRWSASCIEFHLDIEGEGSEYKNGHCWLPSEIAPVIRSVRDALKADGDGIKIPTESEIGDRCWRADPLDGLRPLLHVRSSY